MILNDYELEKRTFEIATVEQKDIDYWCKKFLMAKKIKGCTARTIQHYTQTLKQFFREINKDPLEIIPDDIRYYLAVKEGRDKASKAHLQNNYRVLSSFFQWLVDEEAIQRNPMKRVDNIKVPKTKKSAFSDMEIEKMRNACNTQRETAVMEILLSTGCRVSEVVGIALSDINYVNNSILVHGKGQKDRIVYLNAKALFSMQKYLAERDDNNPWLFPASKKVNQDKKKPVFSGAKGLSMKDYKNWYKFEKFVDPVDHIGLDTIERMIRAIGKRAGVENAHPHRMRRTCATNALGSGMPVEIVSKMLGHESIETTQIYLDISEDQLEQMHKKYVR